MKATRIAGVFAAAAFAACGGSDGDGRADAGRTGLSVEGIVTAAGENGSAGGPLAGATVRLSVDRDGDGRISGDERVEVETDAEGAYRVSTAAERDRNVVVAFEHEGHAPSFRRVKAGAAAELVLNASLPQLEPLECSGSRCAADGNRLSIAGLAEGLAGTARVFNPVTETQHFPGGFDDSDGNLLVSGVFAAVELRDESGAEVDRLDAEVELRMQVPRDTWPVIVDLHPGDDRIDLPLYAFDEAQGTWVRHAKDGWLEDGEGNVVSESEGPAIRAGTYAGALFAAGEVDHFSYWNLDWPIESHACVAGVIQSASGDVAQGATVSASGTSYTGASASFVTGADGRFAIDVMRSEGAGEDVDQDGTPGERHGVRLRAIHGGAIYDLGEFEAPEEQGSDGLGCGDLGALALSEERKLRAELCTVTGTVVDAVGAPVPDAHVAAWDDSLPDDAVAGLCGAALERCSLGVASGQDGSFELTWAAMDNLTLWAMADWQEGAVHSTRWATVGRPGGCPGAPVQIRLDQGWDMLDLVVSVDGTTISWDSGLAATALSVRDAGGQAKWLLLPAEEAATFAGPITYGEVPEGAVQLHPYEGVPAPLAAGDVVEVSSLGWNETGVSVFGSGTATVPENE